MRRGALWDDDSDMILGQVADDRTKKGMVKTFAVVDSGAEANALSREHEAVDSTEAEFVKKDLPRRKGRDPIPPRGERRQPSERMRDNAAGSSGKFAQRSVLF